MPRLRATRSGRAPDAPASLAGGPAPAQDTRRPALTAGSARGRRRAAAGRAFVAPLVLTLLAGVAPVEAQTVTLVSNTGQARDGDADIGAVRFQPITTGDNAAGYTLSSIGISVSTGNLSTNPRIQVLSDETDDSTVNPANVVATLDDPASLTAGEVNTFTTSSDITLAAGTTYYVKIENEDASNDLKIQWTRSGNEDAGAASGWSIADNNYFTSNFTSSTVVYKIQVKGSAKAAVVIPATCETDDLLCTTITVGSTSNSGYIAGVWGSIGDEDFVLNSVTYVINTVIVNAQGQLVVQIRTDDVSGLSDVTFLLDGDSFAVSDNGGASTGDNVNGWFWADAGLSWSVGDTVVLRVVTAAATGPTLSTATVTRTRLVLTYDKFLDEDSTPATSAYSVSVAGGTGTAPSFVSVADKTVFLLLGTAVAFEQPVTVTYTVPGSDPVQDEDGNDAAGLTNQTVTNTTPNTPSRPNTVTGTAVAGGIAVTWTAPDTAGGSAITGYQYVVGVLDLNSDVIYGDYEDIPDSGPGGTNETSYTVRGLDPTKLQEVRVRAVSGLGPGDTGRTDLLMPLPVPAPTITALAVSSTPVTGDTYDTDEEIQIKVTFSAAVDVEGTPSLAFVVGDDGMASRTTAAYASGTGTTDLVFAYTVKVGDEDTTGIFLLNDRDCTGSTCAGSTSVISLGTGGAIVATASTTTAANLALTVGRGQQANHKVDGMTSTTAATVSSFSLTSTPPYFTDDVIEVSVVFSEAVTVTTPSGMDPPSHEIGIDPHGPIDAPYARGTGTDTLVFAHTVVAADQDDDGVFLRDGTTDGALKLNDGTITARGVAAVVNAYGGRARHDDHTVNVEPTITAIAVTSSPVTGDTYDTGETIEISVTFSAAVDVTGTGTPSLAFNLGNSGSSVRTAAPYDRGSGTTVLVFAYAVQAGDEDDNGIFLYNDGNSDLGGDGVISLSTSMIVAKDTTTAANIAFASGGGLQASHKVDGTTTTAAATVLSVSLTSTPSHATGYVTGEQIEVSVVFSEAVTVDTTNGTPTHEIGMSPGDPRKAPYARGTGTATLVFAYTVVATDQDDDGVFLRDGTTDGALELNMGTITAGGVAAVVNEYTGRGLQADHKVNTEPKMTAFRVVSTPVLENDTYGLDEEIRFAVDFDQAVVVTGTPRYELGIPPPPPDRELADYVSGSGTTTLVFAYTVLAGDTDTDGVFTGISPAVELTGGSTIQGLGGRNAVRTHSITGVNHADHKVDGSRTTAATKPPAPTNLVAAAGDRSVALSWTTPGNGASPIISHEYREKSGSGSYGNWTGIPNSAAGGANANNYTVPNRNEGTTYTYQVRAVNAEGDGDPSNEDSATPTAALTAPGLPANLRATPGDTTVVLRWRAPTSGGAPNRYEYRYAAGTPSGSWTDVGTALTVTVTGLTNGESYTFEVRAVNTVDPGPAASKTATPRVAPPPPPPPDNVEATGKPTITGTVQVGETLAAGTTGIADENGLSSPGYTYQWRRGDTATGAFVDIAGATAATYVLAAADQGTYLRVRVDFRDDAGHAETATSDVSVPVAPGNVAASGKPTITGRVQVGETLTAVTSGIRDGDGLNSPRYTYQWRRGDTATGAFAAIAGATAATYVLAAADQGTYIRVRVDFRDDAGHAETAASDASGPVAQNRPPVFTRAGYAFDLPEGRSGQEAAVDLGTVAARDPDGDTLAYALAEDGGGRFAIDAVSGRLRYVGPGEDYEGGPRRYALTVRATDGKGGAAEAAVEIRVIDVNTSPEALAAIPDQVLEVGGEPVTLDLGEYFRDGDGDALAYTALASGAAVAVAVSGMELTVTPAGWGAATVTVTTVDPGGLTATQTFGVMVSDPQVRAALEHSLAALGRGYLSSARMTVGRWLEGSARGETQVTVAGRQVPLSTEQATREGVETARRWVRGLFSGLGNWGHGLAQPAGMHGSGQPAAASPLGGFGGGMGGPGGIAGGPGGMGDRGGSGAGVRGFDGLGGLGGGLGGGQALERSNFAVTLGGGQDDGGQGGSRRGRWAVWGQGDIQRFRNESSAGSQYDGELQTAWLGVDRRVSDDWVLGVAATRSLGESGWQSGAGPGGRLETALTGVQPYARWSNGRTTVWTMAGVGRGDATHAVEGGGAQQASPLELALGLVDVRQQLVGGGFQLDLRGDAAWAQLKTGAGGGPLDALRADVNQARLGIEASGNVRAGALMLSPFGGLSARHDGGTGPNGLGLEVTAGLRATGGRLQLEAQGRMLALHEAAGYEEHGFGLTLSYGSGVQQPGLTVSLSPRWGASADSSGMLWQEQIHRPAGSGADAQAVDARVALRPEAAGRPAALAVQPLRPIVLRPADAGGRAVRRVRRRAQRPVPHRGVGRAREPARRRHGPPREPARHDRLRPGAQARWWSPASRCAGRRGERWVRDGARDHPGSGRTAAGERREPDHQARVSREVGVGSVRRLDGHPGQRGGRSEREQLHGAEPEQRDDLHVSGAGLERSRRRRPVQRGQRDARAAPAGPDESRGGGRRPVGDVELDHAGERPALVHHRTTAVGPRQPDALIDRAGSAVTG